MIVLSNVGLSQVQFIDTIPPPNVNVFFGLDLFPVKANSNVNIRFFDKFSIGAEAEIGINLSKSIIMAGAHFANKNNLFTYQSRDQYDNEKYFRLARVAVFTLRARAH